MPPTDIMQHLRDGLDKFQSKGLDPGLCVMAPDMYKHLLAAARAKPEQMEVNTQAATIRQGYRGTFCDVPVYVSSSMAEGQIAFLPQAMADHLTWDAAQQALGTAGATAQTMADRFAEAAGLAARGINPVGPAVPKLDGPFADIRQIDPDDYGAYAEDGERLMTLTREGANWLVVTFPDITWGFQGNAVRVEKEREDTQDADTDGR